MSGLRKTTIANKREAKPVIPKYPNVIVDLSDCNGNAFAIIAAVMKAMRQEHISAAEQSAFRKEATAGSYDNLMQTCMRWVQVT